MAFDKSSDTPQAHAYFSAFCFNATWDLLDKKERSPEENLMMEQSAHASLWHWKQRSDCGPIQLSVGYWQLARVYASLEQAENSRRYALICQELSEGENVPPFYIAYAYEALARAAAIAGKTEDMQKHLQTARRWAEKITVPENLPPLLKDLDELQG